MISESVEKRSSHTVVSTSAPAKSHYQFGREKVCHKAKRSRPRAVPQETTVRRHGESARHEIPKLSRCVGTHQSDAVEETPTRVLAMGSTAIDEEVRYRLREVLTAGAAVVYPVRFLVPLPKPRPSRELPMDESRVLGTVPHRSRARTAAHGPQNIDVEVSIVLARLLPSLVVPPETS